MPDNIGASLEWLQLHHASNNLADFITDIFTFSERRCLELLLNGEKIKEELVRQTISRCHKLSPAVLPKQ